MRRSYSLALLLVLVAVAACKSDSGTSEPTPLAAWTPSYATPTPAVESWLDKSLDNWNKAAAAVPKPLAMTVDDDTKERCKAQNRPPGSPEDKIVAEAGWTLFGPLQTFGSASMISAFATVDVRCRPVGMQSFVFKDGKFAGTISPAAMDSL